MTASTDRPGGGFADVRGSVGSSITTIAPRDGSIEFWDITGQAEFGDFRQSAPVGADGILE